METRILTLQFEGATKELADEAVEYILMAVNTAKSELQRKVEQKFLIDNPVPVVSVGATIEDTTVLG